MSTMKYTGQEKKPRADTKRKYPTKEEYYLLIAEYKAATGEKKRKLGDVLIMNVEPLIHKFARTFAKKYQRFLSCEDFVQTGRIGVISALRTWDEEIAKKHDVHFTTHVAYWLKSEMMRLVTKEGCQAVRLPHNAYSENRKNLKEGKPLQYPESIRCYSLSGIYKNSRDEDDNRSDVVDRFFYKIGAFTEATAEEETLTNQLGERLTAALQQIPKERDRTILLRRLDGETLDGIAESYGFSRERIRQICMASVKLIGKHVKGEGITA